MKKIVGMLVAVSIIGAMFTGCVTTAPSSSTKSKKKANKESVTEQITEGSEETSESTVGETVLALENGTDSKPQKNGFQKDTNSLIVVGNFQFSIPQYWSSDTANTTSYLAYAENQGKIAQLQISSSKSNATVSFEALEKATKLGSMNDIITKPFDSCGDIHYEVFDNGKIKGYLYTTTFKLKGADGYCELLMFPSVSDNCWIQMILLQTSNTDFSYTDDTAKIRESICSKPEKDQKTDPVENTKMETEAPTQAETKTESQAAEETTSEIVADTTKPEVVETTKETVAEQATPAETSEEAKEPEKNSYGNGVIEDAKTYIKYFDFSREALIEQLKYEGYSREEAEYGADNCGADWNAEALSAAKSYIDLFDFSQSGLKHQLEFDQYTSDQVSYAIDNCGADWMAEALGSAKSYIDFSDFSESGLKNQLKYEGFNDDQISYAIENCGADWNEEALGCAKSYLSFMDFSESELRNQLDYEGFTSGQIDYAIANCGI